MLIDFNDGAKMGKKAEGQKGRKAEWRKRLKR